MPWASSLDRLASCLRLRALLACPKLGWLAGEVLVLLKSAAKRAAMRCPTGYLARTAFATFACAPRSSLRTYSGTKDQDAHESNMEIVHENCTAGQPNS